MRPYSDDGVAVDAEFTVESDGNQFAVILESRGGASKGSAPRNPEYNVALTSCSLGSRLSGLNSSMRSWIQRQPEGSPTPIAGSSSRHSASTASRT